MCRSNQCLVGCLLTSSYLQVHFVADSPWSPCWHSWAFSNLPRKASHPKDRRLKCPELLGEPSFVRAIKVRSVYWVVHAVYTRWLALCLASWYRQSASVLAVVSWPARKKMAMLCYAIGEIHILAATVLECLLVILWLLSLLLHGYQLQSSAWADPFHSRIG